MAHDNNKFALWKCPVSSIEPSTTELLNCRRLSFSKTNYTALIFTLLLLILHYPYAVYADDSSATLFHSDTANRLHKRSVYNIQYYFEEEEDAAAAAAAAANKKKQRAVREEEPIMPSFDAGGDRPQVGQSIAVSGAQIVDSRNQLAKRLPQNVEGMSTLNMISVPTLIKAREMKLTTLYGNGNTDLASMKALLPKEFDAPSAEGDRIAYSLLIEMTAQYYRKYRSNNPIERAKALTQKMWEKGRPIRCHAGTDSFEKTVECISLAGVIDSCVKTVGKVGKSYRGCGLAGHRERGCHNTPSGVVCFCHQDLCNAAVVAKIITPAKLFLVLTSILTAIFLNLWSSDMCNGFRT